jgi:acyl-coenzyme A thioesterase PaaI-like protein
MGVVVDAAAQLGKRLAAHLPGHLRETLALQTFALTKVPMLLYCAPRVLALDAHTCAVRIPLTWRTRNHYGSMYFGALAVGADVAGGLAATYHIRASGRDVGLLFKSFEADFLKRPEGDVVFRCDAGESLRKAVNDAIARGERVNTPVRVLATVPDRGDILVAEFVLTLSMKLAPL